MGVRTRSAHLRHDTLDQIWTAYTTDRDLVHRNELVVAYQPLVNETVQRLPSTSFPTGNQAICGASVKMPGSGDLALERP